MNARFRVGFIQIIHKIPLLRRCGFLRNCVRSTRTGSIGTNLGHTGEMNNKINRDDFRRKSKILIRCPLFFPNRQLVSLIEAFSNHYFFIWYFFFLFINHVCYESF